jgi:hypothetical protein
LALAEEVGVAPISLASNASYQGWVAEWLKAPVLKRGADRFPGFFHCLLDTGCIWILLSPICGAWKDDLTSVAVWVARESGSAVHNGTLLVIEHSSLLARRNSLFLERVAGEFEPSTRDENTVFRVGSLV